MGKETSLGVQGALEKCRTECQERTKRLWQVEHWYLASNANLNTSNQLMATTQSPPPFSSIYCRCHVPRLHSLGNIRLNEYGTLVEWYWEETTKSTRRKTCPSDTSSATNHKQTGLWLNARWRHQFPSRLTANFRKKSKINETKRSAMLTSRGQEAMRWLTSFENFTDVERTANDVNKKKQTQKQYKNHIY